MMLVAVAYMCAMTFLWPFFLFSLDAVVTYTLIGFIAAILLFCKYQDWCVALAQAAVQHSFAL